MQLIIGEKLKKLRRDRNLTQEEVAEHLGISFQAISKWERGDGYPDITMLPALANYFSVTVDDLIGMEEIAAASKLDEINLTWAENRKAGKHQENVKLMREALKTYPGNALLLMQLSASLERLEGTEVEKKGYLKESIAVLEQILHYCADSEIRGAALANIADAYMRDGDYDKALEYAEKLPNFYKTRENMLVWILQDETTKHEVAVEAIPRIVWSLVQHLTVLAETEKEKGYYHKIIAVLDALYGDALPDYAKNLRDRTEARLT